MPPLHGPADFDEFNVYYDRPILDRIHEAGGRVHVHCHGPIAQVFDGFLAMGADGPPPLRTAADGDILAAEAPFPVREASLPGGNLQIHRLYEATPDEMSHRSECADR